MVIIKQNDSGKDKIDPINDPNKISNDSVIHLYFDDNTSEKKITSISSSDYKKYTNLISIDFSNATNLQIIGEEAFAECKHLKNIIFPKTLTNIKNRAFRACTLLQNINLGIAKSLTRIEQGAFQHCYSLQEVILPENLQFIGSFPFSNCFSLKQVTLPENKINIESSAFYRFPTTIIFYNNKNILHSKEKNLNRGEEVKIETSGGGIKTKKTYKKRKQNKKQTRKRN